MIDLTNYNMNTFLIRILFEKILRISYLLNLTEEFVIIIFHTTSYNFNIYYHAKKI